MKSMVLLLIVGIFSSCADVKGTGSSDGSANSNIKTYTLSWVAPVAFEDSSTLTASTDLLEYRIYYGDSALNVTSNVESVTPDKTSLSTGALNATFVASILTVHIAMTSVSKDGVESVLSEVVTFTP